MPYTGTGGVSLMALKLARAAGCKVIVTSSSDQKLARIRDMTRGVAGPEISTVNYRTNPEWDREVIRINGERGADVVLENGGTPTLLKSINATAKRGTVSQIGYLGKQDPKELDDLLAVLIDKAILLR